MSEEHGQIVIGFRQSEVPPTTLCPQLVYFQAEPTDRAWLVRKNSIPATTFIFPGLGFWRSGYPEIQLL